MRRNIYKRYFISTDGITLQWTGYFQRGFTAATTWWLQRLRLQLRLRLQIPSSSLSSWQWNCNLLCSHTYNYCCGFHYWELACHPFCVWRQKPQPYDDGEGVTSCCWFTLDDCCIVYQHNGTDIFRRHRTWHIFFTCQPNIDNLTLFNHFNVYPEVACYHASYQVQKFNKM